MHTFSFLYLKDSKYYYPLYIVKPRFVRGIQVQATHSSIKVSWSVPTTRAGAVMDGSHYNVEYTFGLEQTTSVIETIQTQFELSNLGPYTNILFTITAVYQEIMGPPVFVGISTGNLFLQLHAG